MLVESVSEPDEHYNSKECAPSEVDDSRTTMKASVNCPKFSLSIQSVSPMYNDPGIYR